DLDFGLRLAQYPCGGYAAREVLLGLDQRAVVEGRVFQSIPSGESADPDVPEALAEADEELGSGVATARAVGRALRRGEGGIDAIEVLVVTPVGKHGPGERAESQAGPEDARNIEVQTRLEHPARELRVSEIGCDDCAHRQAHLELRPPVVRLRQHDIE